MCRMVTHHINKNKLFSSVTAIYTESEITADLQYLTFVVQADFFIFTITVTEKVLETSPAS